MTDQAPMSDERLFAILDKARALEAEQALERIRLDESPTFMGEPVLFELGDGASLLLRYGRHDESCATRHDSALKGRHACDCGFSAAIAAIAALQRQPADGDRAMDALRLFQEAKAWLASDSYDGIDQRGRALLEEADAAANLARATFAGIPAIDSARAKGGAT